MRKIFDTTANQRWSLNFISDVLIDGRRFSIMCIIDDFSRECPATVVDNSISGARLARELDMIAERHGHDLLVVVRDNGTDRTGALTGSPQTNLQLSP